jgi:uncharacterized membrane protein YvlD (DUF360 family)
MSVTAFLLPGLRITSVFGALFSVGGIALVNAQLWDASLFFEIPHSVSMRTLVLLCINGLLFWLIVKLSPGIEIRGMVTAVVAPVLFTLTTLLLKSFASELDWVYLLDLAANGIAQLRASLLHPPS